MTTRSKPKPDAINKYGDPNTWTKTDASERTAPDFSETSPTNAGESAGSSSRTQGTNVQSVAVQSTPNYSNLYSANSLTQGANRGQVTDVQNSSETARAMASTSVADPTVLGIQSSVVNPSQLTSQYTAQQSMATPLVNVKKNSPVGKGMGGMRAGTNTDNQYLQNESGALTHAEERQNKYVNQNKFIANPTPQPTAPIPTKIYTRTNLLDQASEDSNPLSILEGNPFIAPQQRFLPQINEEFAPRPEFTAFMSSPFIGVHKTSPIQPNSDNEVTQRKGVADWFGEAKTYAMLHPMPVGLAVVLLAGLWIFMIKGRN